MQFKNALWVLGFPESEDGIVSGALATAANIEIDNLPDNSAKAMMLEVVASRATWVFRGTAAPVDTAASIYLPANLPTRMELRRDALLFLTRLQTTGSTIYTVRAWQRE